MRVGRELRGRQVQEVGDCKLFYFLRIEGDLLLMPVTALVTGVGCRLSARQTIFQLLRSRTERILANGWVSASMTSKGNPEE